MKKKYPKSVTFRFRNFIHGVSDAIRIYANERETDFLVSDFREYIKSHPATVNEDLRAAFNDAGSNIWASLRDNPAHFAMHLESTGKITQSDEAHADKGR